MLIFIFAILAVLPLCASRCEEELKKCSKFPAIDNFKNHQLDDSVWSITYIDKNNQLGVFKNKHCVRAKVLFLKGSTHEIQLLIKSGKKGEKPKIVYTYGTFGSPSQSSILLRHYAGQYKLQKYQAVKTDYKTYIVMTLCAVVNDEAKFTSIIYQTDPFRPLSKKFVEDVERELYEKSKVKIEYVKQSWEECDKEGKNN